MEETEKTAEIIAHELNNIFMTIGLSLEMLSERIAHDEATGRLFAAARHGIERGAKLNQQLLAFSRCQLDQSSATQVTTHAGDPVL
ncbi:histidine kinase dimerization/phospho-acceptor domain-containing protein [Paralcaligenes ginsengisoli]